MTIPSEETRAHAINKALAALEAEGAEKPERIALPWQDLPGQVFPVVRVQLDSVVLNPGSHRIKAQLESHRGRAIVETDPFSEQAQAIMADLLAATEGFEDLKANLREYGQQEAGVVTRSGVLLNANTRAVALRQINPHGHIRLAVLPPEPDPKDIARLELRLQMRRDFKQDYTFTNQLLFVEDLKKTFHYDDEDVAKAMNLAASADAKELKKGAKQAQQLTRMLAMIRDLQARSGGAIPLRNFDDKRQALIDTDDAYEASKGGDAAGAEQMREARYLALLSGYGEYRKLRKIGDAAMVQDYIVPNLGGNGDGPTSPIAEAVHQAIQAAPADPAPPGLADLGDVPAEAVTGQPDLRPLVTLIARSYGQESIRGAGADAPEISPEDLRQHVNLAIGDAVEDKVNEDRKDKNLTDPQAHLRDALDHTKRALEAYRKVATNPEFKAGHLLYNVRKLMDAAEAVKLEIERHDSNTAAAASRTRR
jgi:hypothetical protein